MALQNYQVTYCLYIKTLLFWVFLIWPPFFAQSHDICLPFQLYWGLFPAKGMCHVRAGIRRDDHTQESVPQLPSSHHQPIRLWPCSPRHSDTDHDATVLASASPGDRDSAIGKVRRNTASEWFQWVVSLFGQFVASVRWHGDLAQEHYYILWS